MSANKSPSNSSGNKKIGYTVTPLLFLVLIVVLVNIFAKVPPSETTPETPITRDAAQPATTTRPPILLATILSSPTPTSSPQPTLSANVTIQLLGPPPNSTVPLNGRLALYWHVSEPIQQGQQLVLILQQNEQSFRIGTLTQPNIGERFQLSLDLASLDVVPGTAVWQVHLEWIEGQQTILSSEDRTLSILPK